MQHPSTLRRYLVHHLPTPSCPRGYLMPPIEKKILFSMNFSDSNGVFLKIVEIWLLTGCKEPLKPKLENNSNRNVAKCSGLALNIIEPYINNK